MFVNGQTEILISQDSSQPVTPTLAEPESTDIPLPSDVKSEKAFRITGKLKNKEDRQSDKKKDKANKITDTTFDNKLEIGNHFVWDFKFTISLALVA